MGYAAQSPKPSYIPIPLLSDAELQRELAICDLAMRESVEWNTKMAEAEARYNLLKAEQASRRR
jgi:hypothetical protein